MPVIEITVEAATSPDRKAAGYAASFRHEAANSVIKNGQKDSSANRMVICGAAAAIEEARRQGAAGPEPIRIRTSSGYLANAFRRRWIETWKGNGWTTSDGNPVRNQTEWMQLLEAAGGSTISATLATEGEMNETQGECLRLAAEEAAAKESGTPEGPEEEAFRAGYAAGLRAAAAALQNLAPKD